MSLIAEMVEEMAAAGAPGDVIAIAVRALSKVEADAAERRRKRAEQKAKERAVARQSRDLSQPVVRQIATPSKQKETFPPTPPLLEKLNHPLGDADASLVDEPVDMNEINKIAKAKKERVELFQTVVGMWNELAASNRLVAVRDITQTRQAAIIARSDDLMKTYDFPDPIAGWRKLMGLVRGSPYLRGEINGFRCGFNFIIRASSFTEIMEGKYEARATSRR